MGLFAVVNFGTRAADGCTSSETFEMFIICPILCVSMVTCWICPIVDVVGLGLGLGLVLSLSHPLPPSLSSVSGVLYRIAENLGGH